MFSRLEIKDFSLACAQCFVVVSQVVSIPATTLRPCLFEGIAEALERLERQRQQAFRSFRLGSLLSAFALPSLGFLPQGGGLYAGGSFLQEAESTVTFENCTGASVASGSPLGDDVCGS